MDIFIAFLMGALVAWAGWYTMLKIRRDQKRSREEMQKTLDRIARVADRKRENEE